MPRSTLRLTLILAATWLSTARAEEPALAPQQREFFESRVRPLLATHCFACHGPEQQKAGLRVDSRAALLAGGESGPAIVPGKPAEGFLISAINYGDDYQMPPKGKLKPAEIATLTQWVAMGAPWPPEDRPVAAATSKREEFDLAARAQHWSFLPIASPAPPAVVQVAEAATPIDRFILARLEAAGIAPAPLTDKPTLLRRVTFDLTGLPPTPAELAAFVADDAPDALARVVDRLLASPHYGERWARHWLDLVRYAETLGHEFDFDIPHATEYRDYVIRAFNADVPYDRFVVEHVAGDLLATPRRHPTEGFNESIIGTGFYWLGEQTHSPVDILQAQADRLDNQLDVFGKTFLGLTIGCARCHDHKFDAIRAKDYYALYGFLQSSRYQQTPIEPAQAWTEPLARLNAVRKRLAEALPGAEPGMVPLAAVVPAAAVAKSASGTRFADFDEPSYGGWRTSGQAFGAGPTLGGELVIGAEGERTTLVRAARGWAHSGLVSRRLQGTLQSPSFTIEQPFVHVLAAGHDARINVVIDGFQVIRSPIYGGLKRRLKNDAPEWIAFDLTMWRGRRAYLEFVDLASADEGDSTGPYPDDGYLAVDAVVFSETGAPPAPVPVGALGEVAAVVEQSAGSEPGRRLAALVAEYRQAEARLPQPRLVSAMVDGTPENACVFLRGNPRNRGDEVPRRFLEACTGLEPLGGERSSGRLALAQKLVDRSNPLVARVIVNRLWHHHFGVGLVATCDDFGHMGEAPSHPELLDYLATDFVRGGWSIKRLHRQILLSRTFQRASRPPTGATEKDPDNRLLSHAHVRRLDAEAIRDAMLAISGRWDPMLFGASVAPHITQFMDGRGRPASSGPLDGDGRRSLYIGVRRNFLTPMFLAFDYPAPFSTMGRRTVSHVPAQTLVMMNNPLVVAEARRWSQRVLQQAERKPEERIATMYVQALGREPRADELAAALAFLVAEEPKQGRAQAWADLAHALWNTTEFVFVH